MTGLTHDETELIRRLPKVELHWHLDGSIRATTAIELAKKNSVPLPTYDPDALYPPGYDPDRFFRTLFAVCAVIVTPADYARVAYEAIVDAVAAGNLRYAEIFFQATAHPSMRYAEMLTGLLDGVRAAEEETGIRCNLLPAINRGESPTVARHLVEEIAEHPNPKVIGIGMDGDNFVGPAENFVDAFRLAERHGLHRTAHAGLPLEDTREALDLLHCERIDHGYYVLRDAELLKRAIGDRIHHTACWTCASYYFLAGREHSPIQQMVDAGMSVSINTDDPSVFHTDIGNEYALAASSLGWDVHSAFARVLDGVEGSFLAQDERYELAAQLTNEMRELVAVFAGTQQRSNDEQ